MDFLELAKNRYSERFFDSRPIEDEKLFKILEAGRICPTACNNQPQRFYVLKSKEALELAKELTPYTFGAPVLILVCYDANTVWRNPSDRYYQNYNSGEQDASIAATTMMYEAESLGVHTLWIRGFNSKEFVKRLDLPIRMLPVMILALGYPSADSHPSKLHGLRKPLEEIAFEL